MFSFGRITIAGLLISLAPCATAQQKKPEPQPVHVTTPSHVEQKREPEVERAEPPSRPSESEPKYESVREQYEPAAGAADSNQGTSTLGFGCGPGSGLGPCMSGGSSSGSQATNAPAPASLPLSPAQRIAQQRAAQAQQAAQRDLSEAAAAQRVLDTLSTQAADLLQAAKSLLPNNGVDCAALMSTYYTGTAPPLPAQCLTEIEQMSVYAPGNPLPPGPPAAEPVIDGTNIPSQIDFSPLGQLAARPPAIDSLVDGVNAPASDSSGSLDQLVAGTSRVSAGQPQNLSSGTQPSDSTLASDGSLSSADAPSTSGSLDTLLNGTGMAALKAAVGATEDGKVLLEYTEQYGSFVDQAQQAMDAAPIAARFLTGQATPQDNEYVMDQMRSTLNANAIIDPFAQKAAAFVQSASLGVGTQSLSLLDQTFDAASSGVNSDGQPVDLNAAINSAGTNSTLYNIVGNIPLVGTPIQRLVTAFGQIQSFFGQERGMFRALPGSVWLLATGASLVAQPSPCGDAAYVGFDTRLKVSQAGKLPPGNRRVIGFEIVGGKPVVAFERELIGVSTNETLHIPVQFPVTGLLSDGSSKLVVTAADGVHERAPSGWAPSSRFPAALAPSLHNSGCPLPLVTVSDARTTGFLAWRSMDSSFPIARIAGQLRAVSWNKDGLAAVVGDSLVTWKAGARALRTLRSDPALIDAHDICFLDEGRAVVSTRRAVYLVTAEKALIILGIPARSRSAGQSIFVLDEVEGEVWVVRGSELVGATSADRQFALELLAGLPGEHLKNPRYLEAVRILGCQEANRQIAILQKQAPSTTVPGRGPGGKGK